MHIDCFMNNGKPYLRVAESYSVRENGVRKNRKRTVRNIGPVSRFDDGGPDFLGRLKRSFKEGHPIIDGLDDLTGDAPPAQKFTIEFDRGSAIDSFSDPKNIGYFLLDSLFDSLGLYEILSLHKSRRKISYDLTGLSKLLVFGRLLSPDSRLGTFENRDCYAFPVTKSNALKEIYYALDELHEKSDAIQKRMNLKIAQGIGRDTEICFYDVTNYYFEIGENDPDELDADGNVTRKGLRKKGVSKEKRGEPVVQMGLFIDDNGIPVSYQLFPGSNTDTTTLRPAMKRTVDGMNFGRVVIVADGGLNSGPNIAHILDGGNGYIVSKSKKKSDKNVKAWMLDETGYLWNENRTFKMKSQIRTRKIKAEDGSVREITEKLICYWSRSHYDRERHENQKFIEYLDSVIAFPDKLKDKQKKIEKFLKKTEIDRATGEVVKTVTDLSLDLEKIQEYLDLMGFYTIMTSETHKPDNEIISKYHGLTRIEDSFRITKSDLEGRPVHVWTPGHINAHFLTCFIALTMMRLIQHRILKHQGKATDSVEKWESGLSAERIQHALWDWRADSLPGGYFRVTKPTDDLELILEAVGLNGDLRLPTVKELHGLKYSFDKVIL